MKSYLKNYRQSPRKVRLLANLIRGKRVTLALQDLHFATKRAGGPIIKLIESAVANAKNNFQIKEEDLIIKEIQVNKGIVMKRIMPRAQGSAARINKRTSHISVVLGEQPQILKVSKAHKVHKETEENKKESKKISKKTI